MRCHKCFQIARFDIEFSVTHKELDFSHLLVFTNFIPSIWNINHLFLAYCLHGNIDILDLHICTFETLVHSHNFGFSEVKFLRSASFFTFLVLIGSYRTVNAFHLV